MIQRLSNRLVAIDALRGLVMIFMLLDHVRETFFLHLQVSDPMNVATTEPALFFNRTLAHLCAPIFVFLTGIGAALYAEKRGSMQEASIFLFKRGLLLVVLEVTLVNFAWTFQFPPSVIYLQVIWAIGLSMIALAVLIHLPRSVLIVIGLVLVGGHNLLDAIHAEPGSFWSIPWAIIHDRGWIEVGESLRIRTSYPVLPWIGVIALGYAAGRWFTPSVTPKVRTRYLLTSATAALGLFVILRIVNRYGEKPWHTGDNMTETIMHFFNITKYPPSLLFICLTLGIGLLLLIAFERNQDRRALIGLAVFGGAPMFFYLLHLYVLKAMYLICVAIWGNNRGDYFGFSSVWEIWLCTILLAAVLYFPVRAFARLKARRRDIAWLKYF